MATDSWVNETLYSAWGQRFRVKRELARVRSDFQDIMVFESYSHGHVMLLDGVTQLFGLEAPPTRIETRPWPSTTASSTPSATPRS